jgi:hypothetical protein
VVQIRDGSLWIVSLFPSYHLDTFKTPIMQVNAPSTPMTSLPMNEIIGIRIEGETVTSWKDSSGYNEPGYMAGVAISYQLEGLFIAAITRLPSKVKKQQKSSNTR